MKKWILAFVTMMLLVPGMAFCQTSVCDSLNDTVRPTAAKLLDEIHAYGCCTESILSCLNKKDDACKVPVFLADEVCRLASKGKKADEIHKTLENRARTMNPETPAVSIAMDPKLVWGNPEAKVVLSVYLCGRCPYCSRHVPQLIHALEKTDLKDKIAVNLRYFPIKSHENSTPAALAIEASARLGQAWPYLIMSYENFDSFTLGKITEWTAALGMDSAKINELMKDSSVRAAVSDAKKEGLKNGVTTTPTFFLNGRKLDGRFDVDTVMSILDEALAQ